MLVLGISSFAVAATILALRASAFARTADRRSSAVGITRVTRVTTGIVTGEGANFEDAEKVMIEGGRREASFVIKVSSSSDFYCKTRFHNIWRLLGKEKSS